MYIVIYEKGLKFIIYIDGFNVFDICFYLKKG